jgi:hypothetical protein
MAGWRMGFPGGAERLAAGFASHRVAGAARHDDERADRIDRP